MNLNLWLQLTLDEMHELEQRKDFGITDEDIKDVIRLRGASRAVTVESLTACILYEQQHLDWLRGRAKATGSTAFDQAIACQVTRIDELDNKLSDLSRSIEGMTTTERLAAE